MPIYEVRPGFTHGARSQHRGGDRLELTVEEAAGFLDKLRAVAEEPPAPQPAAPPAAPGPAGEDGAWPEALSNALVRLLRQNGFATPEAVRAARDEDLLAVEGIGARALERIRAALPRE